MIFWACIILGFVIPFWGYVREEWYTYNRFRAMMGGIGLGLIFAFMGVWVGLLLGGFVTSVAGQPEELVDENRLQAFASDSVIEGSFFLFAGTVDEKLTYNYLSVREDGGILRSTAPASRSVVFETDDREPAMMKRVQQKVLWWGVPWGVHQKTEFEFYVPEGAVSTQFEVTP